MATKKTGLIHDNEAEQLEKLDISSIIGIPQPTVQKAQAKKLLKTLYLRIPSNFWEDIQNIANLTGLSMNAVCIDLLRPAIKAKLKILKEE